MYCFWHCFIYPRTECIMLDGAVRKFYPFSAVKRKLISWQSSGTCVCVIHIKMKRKGGLHGTVMHTKRKIPRIVPSLQSSYLAFQPNAWLQMNFFGLTHLFLCLACVSSLLHQPFWNHSTTLGPSWTYRSRQSNIDQQEVRSSGFFYEDVTWTARLYRKLRNIYT